MNSKHRFSVIFAMLSLTVLMLGFQNCSSGDGLDSFDSQDSDSIITPPTIFASKTSNCSQPYQNFKSNENIYMCISNAGTAPIYCHASAQSSTCTYQIVSAANGWSGMNGNFAKGYPAGFFPLDNYKAYVKHTDDPNSIGQADFNVIP
jgi:hypothetical protein